LADEKSWNALVRDRRDQILACTDPEVFEKEVHKLLAELKASHTGFRYAGMRNIPARHAINATLQLVGVNGKAARAVAIASYRVSAVTTMECSMSWVSFTATVHVRSTTDESVA
jgi:hypothetical protein